MRLEDDLLLDGSLTAKPFRRPGLQRFFGSLTASPSASFADHSAGLGAANKRASWDAGSASSSQAGQGRCGQCEKKLGLMKAYLSCDDCG